MVNLLHPSLSRDKDTDTLSSIIPTTGHGQGHNGLNIFLDPSTARQELVYLHIFC